MSKIKSIQLANYTIQDGAVVIAAITSCTNTSNPSVMVAAGLVAKKAVELGISPKPWVKTSLAPGSQVVTEYLERSGLMEPLNKIGFNLVGYGCTTCIGNSGPLLTPELEKVVKENDLIVASVLSGNRNFEGRVHALVKANYLMSPPLVVAYALAGTVSLDLSKDAIAVNQAGKAIYLKDIWPSNAEIQAVMEKNITSEIFRSKYANVFDGTPEWQKIKVAEGLTYSWTDSTYINNPPYFEDLHAGKNAAKDIVSANILGVFGDSITTDHISPAGSIASNSPAAKYLNEKGVEKPDFNSYGARRGNHEVMMRGTFANVRIKNEMLGGVEGGLTIHVPSKQEMSIYDAAMQYKKDGARLVVFGGKDYGMGSSRDWAAKGTRLLGVEAVIAESFERIHRSNLIGMGVLPLTFKAGENRQTVGLTGFEKVTLTGLAAGISPKMMVNCLIERADGSKLETQFHCMIDTENEVEYYLNGGILHKVVKDLAA